MLGSHYHKTERLLRSMDSIIIQRPASTVFISPTETLARVPMMRSPVLVLLASPVKYAWMIRQLPVWITILSPQWRRFRLSELKIWRCRAIIVVDFWLDFHWIFTRRTWSKYCWASSKSSDTCTRLPDPVSLGTIHIKLVLKTFYKTRKTGWGQATTCNFGQIYDAGSFVHSPQYVRLVLRACEVRSKPVRIGWQLLPSKRSTCGTPLTWQAVSRASHVSAVQFS